jgi:hypothetical protein
VTFVSKKTGQFAYFSQQIGDGSWQGKHVLDFGGNIGNILRDPDSTIDEERYWCIDVDEEAVARGKALYPAAHFLHYDRWCFFFNPRGERGLKVPDVGRQFDYIVAYSVFTNTPRADMIELVGQLEALLAGGGAFAFTFMDHRHRPWPSRYECNNFHWRLEQERGEVRSDAMRAMRARADASSWCILVNGEDLYIESDDIRDYPAEEQRTYHAFYSPDVIRSLFPRAEIRWPVNEEMQHCCVIRN